METMLPSTGITSISTTVDQIPQLVQQTTPTVALLLPFGKLVSNQVKKDY